MTHRRDGRPDPTEAESPLADRAANLTWLAGLAERNPDPVLRLARDGRILYLNPGARAVFSGEVQVGVTAPAELRSPLDQAMATGHVVETELTLGRRSFRVVTAPDGDGANAYARDVTERKQTEQTLRETEARIHSALDNLPEAMVYQVEARTDGVRHFTYLSKAVTRLFGCTPAEAIADASLIYQRFVEADRARLAREERQALGLLAPFQSEIRVRKPSGEVGWVYATSAPRQRDDGSVIWDGVVLDVTERKRAELEAARQSAVVTGIARIFSEALTCRTEAELGRTCLAVAEEVTQSRFGFLGKLDPASGKLDDIAISDSGWNECRLADQSGHGARLPTALAVHGVYGRVLRDGLSLFTNAPSAHPDSTGVPPGHPPLTAFMGVPLNHAGETIGMVGLGNREGGYGPDEVAAVEALAPAMVQAFLSKRAAEQLRRSQEEYRHLVEGSGSVILRVDKQMRITFINQCGLKFFGYAPEEIIGKRAVGTIVPETDETGRDTAAMAEDILRRPESYLENVHQNRRKDGTLVSMSWTNQPIYDESGELLEVLSIGHDVSTQRRAEAAPRDAEPGEDE